MPKRLSVGNFIWRSREAFVTVSLLSLHYRNQRNFVCIATYHSRFEPEDDVCCMISDRIVGYIAAIGVCQRDRGDAAARNELNAGQDNPPRERQFEE